MNPNNALHIAKGGFQLAAMMGTGSIIANAAHRIRPPVTPFQKVTQYASVIAMTGLVAEPIQTSADREFDRTVTAVRDFTQKLKDRSEPPKTV